MEPLTKSQQNLRGRQIGEMSVEQLRDWIDACEKMEKSVKYNKARRDWKSSRDEAMAELASRGQ